MLHRIRIDGFKSIDSIDVKLGKLSLLIGPNGAGKSNFIQVFELLGQLIRRELQLSVGKSGGASTLLHSTSRRADRMTVNAEFGSNGYDVSLVPTNDDSLVFEKETAWFHDKSNYSDPFTEFLGVGHRESELDGSPAAVAQYVLSTMNSWVVYHFHDTSSRAAVKAKSQLDDNEFLQPDAANLAAFLFRLRETEPSAYQRIVDAVRSVAPFFEDFQLRPDRLNAGRIQLEWKQQRSRAYFGPHALSDGTLRFICLATLLLQPRPPSLILLDEPELGLHPFAIQLLAEMLEAASQQIILSTQSVTLLNQMDIGNVLIAEQRNGSTSLSRPNLDELQAWMEDYAVGEIWEKNLIGGRPSQR